MINKAIMFLFSSELYKNYWKEKANIKEKLNFLYTLNMESLVKSKNTG